MNREATGSRGRVRAPRLLVFLTGGLAGCASGGSTAEPPAPPPTEPTPATFTTAQADRGERVFTSVCSVCHGRNEFRGPIFSLTWRVEPVGHLFQHISTTMPQDRPGSLSSEQYTSIVAYLLRLNGRAAGDSELPSDVDVLNELTW